MSTNNRYDVICCRHGKKCNDALKLLNKKFKKLSKTTTSTSTSDTFDSTTYSTLPSNNNKKNFKNKNSKYSTNDETSPSSDMDVTTSYASVDEDMPVIDAPMDLNVPLERAMATRVYSLGNVLGEIESNRIRPITSYGKAMTQEQAAVKQKEVSHRQNLYARFFLGCKTSLEAEASVQRRTSFRLYYKLNQNVSELIEDMSNDVEEALTPSLPLFVIYKPSVGHYRHYEIKTKIDRTGDTWYFVHYGDPRSKLFRSIYRLVEHYSEFVTIPGYKGRNVDVFPFWKGDTEYERFGVIQS